MRVAVSVLGKFHAFRLARELERHGVLSQLLTTYPAGFAERDGVPSGRITAFPSVEMAHRLARRFLPAPRASFYAAMGYGALSVAALEPSDICVAWSGSGLPILTRAKTLGAKTIVERGSTHILNQYEVLEREHDRVGLPLEAFHLATIAQELEEYALADRIRVPTHFAKRTFLERGFPEEKLIQVPYGVDLKRFRPEPKRDSIFRVLFVGALSIQKGVHILLEACAPLVKEGEFELVLVGAVTAGFERFMRRYEGTYRHLGVVPNTELRHVYSQASVFSLLSFQEGLAMVQAEAMACGLPLVVTPNTGSEDIMTDGVHGIMVEPGNVEQIREAFLRLKNDSELRASMAQKALEKSQQNLSWQRYGDEIVRAYLELHASGAAVSSRRSQAVDS